jgi:hypothetical protein
MKTTKLLSILLLLLIQQSCSKENNNSQSYNPQNFYFYLTAEQLNQTPYFTNKAFDTISFTSDKGDTLTFVKTKTDTSWYCEPTTSNPNNNDQNCYQTLHNTYTTIKGIGSFDVKHILKGAISSYRNKIEFNFDNIAFWAYDDWINWNGFTTFKENLFLNNYNYKSSITIYINPSDTFFSNSCKINKDFGIFFISNKTKNLNWLIIKP